MRITKTHYIDKCGCVWKNGKRIELCAEHRHKYSLVCYSEDYCHSTKELKYPTGEINYGIQHLS